MRADTVDCVMFILRAVSTKLPVSATIRNVRARLMSIGGGSGAGGLARLIYRNFDWRHRKNPFVDALESYHSDAAPGRVGSQSPEHGLAMEGLTTMKAPAKKPAAKKPAAKAPAKKAPAKKKK